MISKSFKINIIIRIALLLIVMAGIAYLFIVSKHYLRGSYLIVLLAFQVIELFRYVDKTNRDLSNFFLSIKERDFSTHYRKDSRGGSFEMLYESMNIITKEFENLSVEREVQFNFLSLLVNHVNVGILSFDEEEKIQLMNPTLEELLQAPSVPELKMLATSDELKVAFRDIRPGDRNLLPLQISDTRVQLALHASEFKLDGEYYKLISIQNVHNELENNELEAWQKLIRVLTHEIMNSATPITSLSDTLLGMMESKGVEDPETRKNLSQGLEAIKVRSAGLHTFTQAYQTLTKLPAPQFSTLTTAEFFSPLLTLFEDSMKEEGIDLRFENSIPDQSILIDKELLGQVLINLIKNASESIKDKPNAFIKIGVHKDISGTKIDVTDNGGGIEVDIREKIFVPFFTTKKEGSGIGLALSRQIVHLHNGTLSYDAIEKGSKFTIRI